MGGSPAPPTLQFLGATGTVTGSRFLLDGAGARVLVDCGLYQGRKELRQRNWKPFPVDPATIDAVLLTHAHIDHSGYLPALARDGFRGPVFATEGTCDLARILLLDSGRLHEEDAAFANRKRFSKHEPALPLYREEDAARMLEQLRPVRYEEPAPVASGFEAVFRPAGHILGSSTIEVRIDGATSGARRTVIFSGDLGRPSHPIFSPPAPLEAADCLVIESTYGDRLHGEDDPAERFAEVVNRTAERGGMLLVPAFAVDRTEVLLFHLKRLTEAGRIPPLPVFVDSPMALRALELYRRAVRQGDREIRPELRGAESPFDPGSLVEAHDVAASKSIQAESGPGIVISASGMATGGRVLYHLERRLPDPRNSVALVGYQAAGTRGRRLLAGERLVKMLGRYVPVRAEVVDLTNFSVHADRGELLDWLRAGKAEPEVTFVVHGEADASRALCEAIGSELGWGAVAPSYRERVRI